MASRIAIQKEAPMPSRKTARVESASYLSWIRRLPCVVTKTRPAEAAHVSFANRHYGAPGRAKGRKVSDRWALPLCQSEHIRQHSMNEALYWRQVGIDPHDLACRLWGIWNERGEDATDDAEMIVMTAYGTCQFR